MNHYVSYRESTAFELEKYPFYALVMAAMRRADSNNLEKLKSVFPELWQELQDRYTAPGGFLSREELMAFGPGTEEERKYWADQIFGETDEETTGGHTERASVSDPE